MMMKKEVAICDVCKDRLAENKKGKFLQCDFCGHHVCDNCYEEEYLEFMDKEINVFFICEDCTEKIRSSRIKIDKSNEMKNQLIGHFKKVFIVKALENKK